MNTPRLQDGDRLLRLASVAEIVDLSVKSIRRMIDRGELPAVKLGGALRVRESALHALLAKSALKT